ncbi:hypothetical protein LCM20_19905 [Halobacillus litoralis]|uniref:hypothetical protein n=1 Tax=Halobacillus litoralis TaxID=45668 RepID=UPI001CD4853F|nr:hypothetical protein [Halobacillus litoralis]MCA0972852.1 hypothetical protein [Halobacillus litoralis]
MERNVYFSDQFFSAGRTEIYNESRDRVGTLDLKSAFTSSVNIENQEGEVVIEAAFPFLSGRWSVSYPGGSELGSVKASFSFFSKRYCYETDRGRFEIESPALSGEYTIYDESESTVAVFHKVSGFFQASAYELQNHSDSLATEELIAVVMGVNAIQKRRSNAANT